MQNLVCDNCESKKDVIITDWGETLCKKCIKTIEAMDKLDDEADRRLRDKVYGPSDY